MILKIIENQFKLIGDSYDDEEFLSMNPTGFVSVESLPESVSKMYIKDAEGNYIVDEMAEFICIQKKKFIEIEKGFTTLLSGGSFMCSLGFEIDNRRYDEKDDKDNVQSLISLNLESTSFKDTDGVIHQVTTTDLQTMMQEMIMDGLGKYQWKWTKEYMVYSATTIEQLNGIEI